MRRSLLLALVMVPFAGCGVVGNPAVGAAREAPPPPAQPFCTRSLGSVDCWASAADQPLPARPGVADGPVRPTAAQERVRGHVGVQPPAPDDPAGH